MKAFTLVEVITVVIITVLLLGGVFFGFSNRLSLIREDSSINQTVQLLRKAQFNSISRFKDKQWGVNFDIENKKITLFAGNTYVGRDMQYDSVFDVSVAISTVSLNGGGNEIVFKKTSGDTTQYGEVKLRDSNGKIYTIFVSQIGQIELK